MNTLGEGGMFCTNNKKIFQTAWSLRDCGKNIHSVRSINKKILNSNGFMILMVLIIG